jgi:hypothetical protein
MSSGKVEIIDRVLLSGSLAANAQSQPIEVLGKRKVSFWLTAADANTLSVAQVQVSNDGTNWFVAGTASVAADVNVNNAATGVALNTGGRMLVLDAFNGGGGTGPGGEPIAWKEARVNATPTGAAVTGFSVAATVHGF